MKKGFIKLKRSIIDSKVWCNGNGNTFKLYSYCLIKANYEDKIVNGVKVEKGSFLTSEYILASELHMSKNTIRKNLNILINLNEISIDSSPNGTKISVTDYTKEQEKLFDSCSKNEPPKKGGSSKNELVNGLSGSKNELEVVQNLTTTKKDNKNKEIYSRAEHDTYSKEIKIIIDYLNEKTGKKYRYRSKGTQRIITARLNEGFTVEDFKTVIDNKVNDWLNDSKMSQYLRPETLFGNKFEGYLNQSITKKKEFHLPKAKEEW